MRTENKKLRCAPRQAQGNAATKVDGAREFCIIILPATTVALGEHLLSRIPDFF